MIKLTNQLYKIFLLSRIWLAKAKGVQIGSSAKIGPQVDFNVGGGFRNRLKPAGAKGRIQIADHCWLERGVVLWAFDGTIRMGNHVFLGPYVTIYGHGGVEIGDGTLVSMKATILSSNHKIPSRERHIRWEPSELLPTKIGRDVWIGANAVILAGITIGNGCVVGAGAVVTSSLPAYSVAVGVPAKVVKMRT
jgi:acetyltransferase-like isoleucine patch superfamily enzyme